MDESLLIIIPARAGSKRLPDKNMRDLRGKPLVRWTIDRAIDINAKNKDIVVSTDSDDIWELCRGLDRVRVYYRPEVLCTDESPVMDTVFHVLNEHVKEQPYLTMLLQPTSPLRLESDITNAIETLYRHEANSVISVCPSDPPQWANTLPPDGYMEGFLSKDIQDKRSQELSKYYRLNGSIFIARTEALMSYGTFHMPGTFAYIMPKERSVDIDDEFDLGLADYILSERIVSAYGYLDTAFKGEPDA